MHNTVLRRESGATVNQRGQDRPRSCLTPWIPGVITAIDGPRHTVRPPDATSTVRYTRHPTALKLRFNPAPPAAPGTAPTTLPPLPPLPPSARAVQTPLAHLPPLPPVIGSRPVQAATTRRNRRLAGQ